MWYVSTMSSYPISVVGESFDNADGSSRQDILRRCRAGDPVTLEREPDNPYDPNAVKVVTRHGCIGMIGRQYPWICERIDRGAFIEACIQSVGAGDRGQIGAVLLVSTDLATPQEATPVSERPRIPPPADEPRRGFFEWLFGR
jgi:hypothetical protein